MAVIFILSILIKHSYFQLNALKHGLYRFSGSASPLVLSVRATENEAMTAIFILSILLNQSYFQLNALKHGIYRFSESASHLKLNIAY